MPVMDGWEFLEEYHQLEEHKKGNIIIIMLTTSLNPDDKSRAENISDVSGYKNKPLKLEMIKDIMRKHFPDYI
jgi:CheY-like chemotaxis protein